MILFMIEMKIKKHPQDTIFLLPLWKYNYFNYGRPLAVYVTDPMYSPESCVEEISSL